jgi:hypothetical protein
MRFYNLVDDMTISGRWIIGEVRNADGDNPTLDAGRRFTESKPLYAEIANDGSVLDFSLSVFAVPIATIELAMEVVRVVGPDVNTIPIDVAGQYDMRVLNSVRAIRCLDENRSEFLKFTRRSYRADLAGQYQLVSKLCLDPTSIPSDANFFRVEGWAIALIVSEQVKIAMERIGCFGAEFIQVA